MEDLAERVQAANGQFVARDETAGSEDPWEGGEGGTEVDREEEGEGEGLEALGEVQEG